MKWLEKYQEWIVLVVVIIVGISFLILNKWIMSKYLDRAKQASVNKNVSAFLAMIRWSENKAAKSDIERYRTLYGGAFFNSFSDHPYITGEWQGAKLPDAYCRGAGLSNGCKTTAAGGYQFISTTWKNVKSQLGLKDFSPESQDLAAIQLIQNRKALELIETGQFDKAINILRAEWASLPGSSVGQPTNSLIAVRNMYSQNGGNFA